MRWPLKISVQTQLELEDTFSVQFEDNRIEALKNVGEVVTYIDQLTP